MSKTNKVEIREKCADCDISIGELHIEHCDIARCGETGYQLLSCGNEIVEGHICRNTRYKGFFPGQERIDIQVFLIPHFGRFNG